MVNKVEGRHKLFLDSLFWQKILLWQNISYDTFCDYKWQMKNSIKSIHELKMVLGDVLSEETYSDLMKGTQKSSMNIRLSPYVISLINWRSFKSDPLRKQFLLLDSEILAEHPCALNDPLAEDIYSPVSNLIHRYPDKVLFLLTSACPVYCSYCTRSRLVGGTTQTKEKLVFGSTPKRWEAAVEYLRRNDNIEDVVLSGGDMYQVPARHIGEIGHILLDIPHIRRIRYATKGLAVMPMKILTDNTWVSELHSVVDKARKLGKHVALHTHFCHPNEITKITNLAMQRLYLLGIPVRNQTVLQAGVNDHTETMSLLIKKLSYMNIQPYYIYVHDLVQSCEHYRTTIGRGVELEKQIRGLTAGFNTPTVVCDLPLGGGKRSVCSYEHYDREYGISIWHSPRQSKDKYYYYFDPIHLLSVNSQKVWRDKKLRQELLADYESRFPCVSSLVNKHVLNYKLSEEIC